MGHFQINPNALKNLFESKQTGTKDVEWLKLKAGNHQLRICPPWSQEGSVSRYIVQHGNMGRPFKDNQGNQRQPICYKYIFNAVNDTGHYLAKILADKKVLQQNDVVLYQKYGCPGCRVAEIFKNSNNAELNNLQMIRSQYMWNVVARSETDMEHPDGKSFKFNQSKKFYDAIYNAYNMYPDLFHPEKGYDFIISATGEQLNRRYSLPQFIPAPRPLGQNIKIYDLDDAMAQGYRTYPEWMELINNTFPEVMPLLGIQPQMFDDKPPW